MKDFNVNVNVKNVKPDVGELKESLTINIKEFSKGLETELAKLGKMSVDIKAITEQISNHQKTSVKAITNYSTYLKDYDAEIKEHLKEISDQFKKDGKDTKDSKSIEKILSSSHNLVKFFAANKENSILVKTELEELKKQTDELEELRKTTEMSAENYETRHKEILDDFKAKERTRIEAMREIATSAVEDLGAGIAETFKNGGEDNQDSRAVDIGTAVGKSIVSLIKSKNVKEAVTSSFDGVGKSISDYFKKGGEANQDSKAVDVGTAVAKSIASMIKSTDIKGAISESFSGVTGTITEFFKRNGEETKDSKVLGTIFAGGKVLLDLLGVVKKKEEKKSEETEANTEVNKENTQSTDKNTEKTETNTEVNTDNTQATEKNTEALEVVAKAVTASDKPSKTPEGGATAHAPDVKSPEGGTTPSASNAKGTEEKKDDSKPSDIVDKVGETADKIKDKTDETTEGLTEAEQAWKDKWDNILAIAEKYAKAITEASSGIFSALSESADIDKQEAEEKLAEVSKKYDEVQAKRKKSTESLVDLQNKAANAMGGTSLAMQEQINAEMAKNEELKAQETQLAAEKAKAEKEKEKAEKKKKKLEAQKGLVEGTINIAQGVLKAWSLGPILGPILGSLVAAAGAVQIAIMAKNISRLADGGLLRGRRHSEGGMRIEGTNIEVEGGEYVINRRTTDHNLGLIRYINSQRRPLSEADMHNYFRSPQQVIAAPFRRQMQEGGMVAPQISTPQMDNGQLLDAIRSIHFEPRVAVTDIIRAQDQMASVDSWVGM